MMMIYLIRPQFGDVNVENPNAKKIIVNVLLEIKNVHLYVNAIIVKIKKRLLNIKINNDD